MNRSFYKITLCMVYCAMGLINGMELADESIDYSQLEKESTQCTRLGIALLKFFESSMKTLIGQKNSLIEDEFTREYLVINSYISALEMEVVVSAYLDEMEKSKDYKIKRNFLAWKKCYVSEIIWDNLVKKVHNETKKNIEDTGVKLCGSNLTLINPYKAALSFTAITEERQIIHRELGFKGFYNKAK